MSTSQRTYAGPTIVLCQDVAAPIADVYAAWTDSAQLASWWWASLPDTTHEVEATVGGRLRVASELAALGATGTFVEVVEPRRLMMDWRWETGEGQGEDDLVTLELRAHSHGTLVILTHQIADAQADTSLRDGWTGALASLAATVGSAS